MEEKGTEKKGIEKSAPFIASRAASAAISVMLSSLLLDPFQYVERAKKIKGKYSKKNIEHIERITKKKR